MPERSLSPLELDPRQGYNRSAYGRRLTPRSSRRAARHLYRASCGYAMTKTGTQYHVPHLYLVPFPDERLQPGEDALPLLAGQFAVQHGLVVVEPQLILTMLQGAVAGAGWNSCFLRQPTKRTTVARLTI